MTSIPNFKVSRNVALNPVARSIERQRLAKWFQTNTTELLLLDQGEECGSIVRASAEAIGCAIKSIEGFDDPEDVGGFLVDALADLTRIAQGGFKWDKTHAARVSEALDMAVQILTASDARTKLKAWAWAQRITGQVLEAA